MGLQSQWYICVHWAGPARLPSPAHRPHPPHHSQICSQSLPPGPLPLPFHFKAGGEREATVVTKHPRTQGHQVPHEGPCRVTRSPSWVFHRHDARFFLALPHHVLGAPGGTCFPLGPALPSGLPNSNFFCRGKGGETREDAGVGVVGEGRWHQLYTPARCSTLRTPTPRA